MKHIRTYSQFENVIVKDFRDEERRLERLIEEEEDVNKKFYYEGQRQEIIRQLNDIEKMLDENPNLFK